MLVLHVSIESLCVLLVASLVASDETCEILRKDTNKNQYTEPAKPANFNGCQIVEGTFVLETLPGQGWDNLRNVAMAPVLSLGYSMCRSTYDRKFLIPDNVFVKAIKESNAHVYSRLISHISNYTSLIAVSINVEAEGTTSTGLKLSGSFSTDYQEAKSKIVNEKSILSRSELRYRMYSAGSNWDSQLHPSFKNRVLDIASSVQANDTETARYLSDLLVRDYGTHYVTTVDAGALIVQEDHLTSKYVETMQRQNISVSAAAGANFNNEYGGKISVTVTVSKEQMDQYLDNRTDTRVLTMGGPPYEANFSSADWSRELENNLVIIDRNGDPLYYAITPQTLPELPMETTFHTVSMVKEAVHSYYEHNMYRGCTDMDSPRFSFLANVDDGSCTAAATNYSFGGIYQSCTGGLCDAHKTQMHPKTKDFKCPEQYTGVLLHQHKAMKCVRRCKTSGSGLKKKKHCHKECHHSDTSEYTANYEAHWCAAKDGVEQDSGYLFGGVYTAVSSNPLTGAKSCPQHYVAVAFGVTLTMYVCVSDDYELGFRHSIPFAGFFSCLSGNPLVFNKNFQNLQGSATPPSLASFVHEAGAPAWPKRCPPGYSQHLLAVTDACAINYCVTAHALSGRTPPIIERPPFLQQPQPVNFATRLFVGYDGKIWMKVVKDGYAQWQPTGITANDETMECVVDTLDMSKSMEISTLATCGKSPNKHDHDSDKKSSTSTLTITFITVGSALVAMVIIATVGYVMRYYRRQREYRSGEGFLSFADDQDGGERAALLK